MATTEEKIVSTLKEFAKYRLIEEVKEKIDNIVEEAKENLEKEIETIVIKREPLYPIDKKREEKKWKQSVSYYLLNPQKFTFGLRDFK
ncbi:MAG: hypothetical protein JSV62_07860 [Promethearchaeota archaeon]|nr:MAG: hypothetical protein JSV62_07860 [Candidatus Lokiarchaeota archaeon]